MEMSPYLANLKVIWLKFWLKIKFPKVKANSSAKIVLSFRAAFLKIVSENRTRAFSQMLNIYPSLPFTMIVYADYSPQSEDRTLPFSHSYIPLL